MSNKVDNRVVSMQFDNKDFERNTATSMKTLDNLKKSLDLTESSKNLANLSNASKGFHLNGLTSAADAVSDKFGAMEIAGITALVNLTNAAINYGSQIVKALTIDPVLAGYQEYELKMGAIQTIMAGTGESLDKVNEKLNELNEYSDKTIYSFSDMTQNIGKFTNAGVKLDDAVDAIRGVANVAAVSGANAGEASRAMYNLGQAMGSGVVRLMDWKSVNMANMGTMEFKQQIIDTALAIGTLVKEGDKYISTTTDMAGKFSNVFTSTKGFEESLSAQWFTADVLTQTLQRYSDTTTDIGKKAETAAVEIKTLSMMYDSLKEAAQSGWTQTWEILAGDFTEGKTLWTDINNVVSEFLGNQAMARNELLQGWKDLGGRTEVIETFKNVFGALSDAIAPIKEAFRDIFPATTAQDLYDITHAIYEFSEKLEISETTIYYIRQAFRVFFAVLKTGVDIFKGLAGGIGGMIEALFKGESMLTPFKEMLDGFFDDIKKNYESVFTEILDTKGFAKEIAADTEGVLKKMGESIKKTFEEAIGSLDGFYAELDKGAQKIKDTNVFGGIEDTLSGVTTTLTRFKQVIQTFFGAMGGTEDSGWQYFMDGGEIVDEFMYKVGVLGFRIRENFYHMGEAIKNFFKGLKTGFAESDAIIGESEFFDRISSFGEGLRRFVDILGNVWDGIKKFASPFIALVMSVVDTITKLFQALGRSMDENGTDTLFDIFNSAMFLTLLESLRQMMRLFANLAKHSGEFVAGITDVLDGTRKCLGAYQKTIMAGALQKIAVAVALLAASIFLLALVDPTKLGIATGAITAMFAELVVAMSMMTKVTKATEQMSALQQMTAVSIGIIGMATALLIMAHAMKILSKLSWDEVALGIGAMTAMMTGLVVAINKMMGGGGKAGGGLDSERMMKLSLTLIAFASSIKILAGGIEKIAGVVGKIGGMDMGVIAKGLMGITYILGSLYAFLKYADFAKMGLDTAAALFVFSISLNLIAIAMSKIGQMDAAQLTQGLVVLTAVLGQLVLFNMSLGEKKGIDELAVGMLALSAAILGIAFALKLIASISTEDVVKAVATFGLIMTGLVLGMNKLNGGLQNVAGLVAMAGALLLMSVALKLLSSIPFTALLTGIVGLAGVIGILVLAGWALRPVVSVFEGLGIAALMIGAAMFLAGAGLALFASGLAVVIGLGAAAGGAISLLVMEIVKLIPEIAIALAKGLVEFIRTIGEYAPTIIDTLVILITEMLDALLTLLPKVKEVIIAVVRAVIDILRTLIPEAVPLIKEWVQAILNVLEECIPDILTAGMNILLALLEGVRDKIADIVKVVGEIITTFLDEFANQIENIADKLVKTLIRIINAVTAAISGNTEEFVKAVKDMFIAIINLARDLGHMFADIGGFIWDGIAKGLGVMGKAVKDAIWGLGGKIRDAFCWMFGIDSPSTVFAGYGENLGEGLIIGIKDIGSKVKQAALGLGSEVDNGVTDSLSGIDKTFGTDIDINPTITPVVDMTDVQKGIDTTFANQPVLDVGSVQAKTANVAASAPKKPAYDMPAIKSEFTPVTQPASITVNNNYEVRNDTDIRKISKGLETTLVKFESAKGVLAR